MLLLIKVIHEALRMTRVSPPSSSFGKMNLKVWLVTIVILTNGAIVKHHKSYLQGNGCYKLIKANPSHHNLL